MRIYLLYSMSVRVDMKRKIALFIGILCLALVVVSPNAAKALDISLEDDLQVSGKVVTGITWEIKDNTLTITGSGSLPDREKLPGNRVPWWDYRGAIHKIVIGEGITSIGDSFFYLHEITERVVLPESLMTIGNGAFMDCMNLDYINLPGSLVSIGDRAFSNCSFFREKIVIPASLNHLGEGAFAYCHHLYEVEIRARLTEIPANCFVMCGWLKSVNIPSSVKKIGKMAFYDSMPILYLEEGFTSFDSSFSVDDIYSRCTIVWPASVTYIEEGLVNADRYYTFYGTKGSYIEEYALAHGSEFHTVEELEWMREHPDGETLEEQTPESEENANGQQTEETVVEDAEDDQNELVTDEFENETEQEEPAGKQEQILEVSKRLYTVKAKNLKKSTKKIELDISSFSDEISFKKISGNKKIKVSGSGIVTVPKNMKKGTYSLKIRVSVPEDEEYLPLVQKVTIKVRVK